MAMEWYQKTAEQRDEFAENNIGCLYEHGEGVVEDRAMAMEWYRKAAEKGHVLAKESVGRLEE